MFGGRHLAGALAAVTGAHYQAAVTPQSCSCHTGHRQFGCHTSASILRSHGDPKVAAHIDPGRPDDVPVDHGCEPKSAETLRVRGSTWVNGVALSYRTGFEAVKFADGCVEEFVGLEQARVIGADDQQPIGQPAASVISVIWHNPAEGITASVRDKIHRSIMSGRYVPKVSAG